MEKTLVNRVANSGLITIKLEDYFPSKNMVDFDLKQYLFMELILKEKDFRKALKEIDWAAYKDTVLLVYCSTDSIIPVWAYMLVAAHARPFAFEIFLGTKDKFLESHYKSVINTLDVEVYREKRVVIKGCSDKEVPNSAYLDITSILQPVAQSIMYGEPCSTVPVFKRPRKLK